MSIKANAGFLPHPLPQFVDLTNQAEKKIPFVSDVHCVVRPIVVTFVLSIYRILFLQLSLKNETKQLST